MKKSFFAVIIIVCFNISCNKENNLLFPLFTSEYFPLQVGNKWTFESSFDNNIWVYEITDTKVFDEHVYFERVLTFSDGTNMKDYFRVTENNIVLIYFEGRDYIYINFEGPIGEVWDSFGQNFGYVRQRNLSAQVDAGTFNDVLEIFFDNRAISDVYEFNHYAPGVGLVESIRFRFILSLTSARVNGINYP